MGASWMKKTWGPIIFAAQYATKMLALTVSFLVCPDTLPIGSEMAMKKISLEAIMIVMGLTCRVWAPEEVEEVVRQQTADLVLTR